jgi:transcriptional regulator with XRE-family HTH domain
MNDSQTKPIEHDSSLVARLLDSNTPEQRERIRNRMLIAAKIDEAIKSKCWSRKRFAEEMGKGQPEISKWLSGTHNFTSDTLSDIGLKLGIALLATKEDWTVTHVVENVLRLEVSALPGLYSKSNNGIDLRQFAGSIRSTFTETNQENNITPILMYA